MLKKIAITIILSIIISSCGKKSRPAYPGGQKVPTFNKIYDKGSV